MAKQSRLKVRPPGAGRPTAERVAEINDAILETARSLFLSAGYELTAMETIAAEAKVSKGTLYARYPTKDALRRAVILHEVGRVSAIAAARMAGPKPADLKQCLRHHARRIMEILASPETAAFIKLMDEYGHPGGDFMRVLDELNRAAIADIAKDMDERAPSRARDSKRAAEMLIASLHGWLSLHRNPDKTEGLRYADYMVEVILTGRAAW